ncbi:MAG: class I SAM-dependent methyltransferase [Candidatus Daviesbacteria bacterium]|nr:class I SAM-dependent methyltransferase [Candidatus Daviesbacteria bacterium]
MKVLIAENWEDYELIDSGDGRRLERFGGYLLSRPDPQIIWKPSLPKVEWEKATAAFEQSWKLTNNQPEKWLCKYQNISFWVKLSPFKHTGVFPEQAVHWEFIHSVILNKVKNLVLDPSASPQYDSLPNVLNLFAYTGIASLVSAKAGAKVTHVDASYPAIGWFQENIKASGLESAQIRWIEDDVLKFCEREVKRGVKYDGIIMDPPVYGHGPKGETWDFNKSFPKLLALCQSLLTDKPLFVIANAYAISSSAITLENVFKDYFGDLEGDIESGELALKESGPSERILSTGIFARWSEAKG